MKVYLYLLRYLSSNVKAAGFWNIKKSQPQLGREERKEGRGSWSLLKPGGSGARALGFSRTTTVRPGGNAQILVSRPHGHWGQRRGAGMAPRPLCARSRPHPPRPAPWGARPRQGSAVASEGTFWALRCGNSRKSWWKSNIKWINIPSFCHHSHLVPGGTGWTLESGKRQNSFKIMGHRHGMWSTAEGRVRNIVTTRGGVRWALGLSGDHLVSYIMPDHWAVHLN